MRARAASISAREGASRGWTMWAVSYGLGCGAVGQWLQVAVTRADTGEVIGDLGFVSSTRAAAWSRSALRWRGLRRDGGMRPKQRGVGGVAAARGVRARTYDRGRAPRRVLSGAHVRAHG